MHFSRRPERVKDFKLWDLKANKVVISRDAIFFEKAMLRNTQKGEKQGFEKS